MTTPAALTNVEMSVSGNTQGEMVDVFCEGVDDQSTGELGGSKPEWIVRLLVQLELRMHSVAGREREVVSG